MSEVNEEASTSEYYSARSRSSSMEAQQTRHRAHLAPLNEDRKRAIGVSKNPKRAFKDRRIYLDSRTNLPVRPPTSFGLFKHALRRNIKDPRISFQEFNKCATEAWNKMDDVAKEPYVLRAKTLAEEYKKIEAPYLRRRVRELQRLMKEQRRNQTSVSRGRVGRSR